MKLKRVIDHTGTYWVASGNYNGRKLISEGYTHREAVHGFTQMALAARVAGRVTENVRSPACLSQ